MATLAAEPIEIRLPRLHASQREIVATSRRFNVVNVGRRWGKTTLGIDETIRVLLAGGRVAWMAPVYKLIGGEGGMWPLLVSLIPRELITHIDNTNCTMALTTGGSFEAWSLDLKGAEDRFRGRENDLVIIDEAAYIGDLLSKFERSIAATLVDRRGRAWLFSTPNGYNDFWELYQRGQDEEKWPDWQSWTLWSNARPSFPEDEWERLMRQADPAFGQEYKAEFTAPQGLVLGLDADGTPIYDPAFNCVSAPVSWAACRWRIAMIDPGGDDPTGFAALGISDGGGPKVRPLRLGPGEQGPRLLGAREAYLGDRYHVYHAERRGGAVGIDEYHQYLSAMDDAAPLTRVVVGETGGMALVNSLRRLGWDGERRAPAVGFVKDLSVSVPLIRSLSKSRKLTFGQRCQSVFPPYPEIDMRKLVESEVYTWMFVDRPVGGSGRQTWNTTTNVSAHHADVLNAVKDGLASVQVSYPGASQGAASGRQALAVGVSHAV